MNYIIFKADGSINEKKLAYYIQQGNTGVDTIFVSKADIEDEGSYTCQAFFKIPNGTTNTLAGVWTASVEYKTGVFANGWMITLTTNQTTYNGLLQMSVSLLLSSSNLLTYPVALVINETGYQPDEDSGVTIEEINSYLVQLQSYQLKYDLANVRGYDTLVLATADLPNLADGQMVIIRDGGSSIYQVQAGELVDLIVNKATSDSLGNVIKDSYVSAVYPTYNTTTDKLFIETYSVEDVLMANNEVILPKATTTKNGLMAKEDKVKVDSFQSQIDGKQSVSEKNQANGYVGLDSNAKIPTAYIPDSILGQLEYKGTYDCSSGVYPTPIGLEKGWYYIASSGGTISGVVFEIGDWLVYNGSTWDKIDNSNDVAKLNKTISIIYTDLKSLRDTSQLIKGQQYRITDFVTTTAQTNTQSAGHAFDLIVVADDVNKLNEQARAIIHSGDTYFANSKLEAWQVWYCLDNDTSRFNWVDGVNGKGVIYRLIDEFANDIPYDLKNIQYLVNATYVYTFGGIADDTLSGNSFSNKIGKYNEYIYPPGIFKHSLNKNTFGNGCHSNTFGSGCSSNTFGNGCYSNTFGAYCSSNTFGNGCSSNTFGNGCYSNTFGNGCSSNTFGNGCYSNTFGNSCSSNTFGAYCSSNKINIEGTRYNIFENGIKYIDLQSGDVYGGNHYLQNIHISMGIVGASTQNMKVITEPRDLTHDVIYRATGSEDKVA